MLAELHKSVFIIRDSALAIRDLIRDLNTVTAKVGFNPNWSAARKKAWRRKTKKHAAKAVSKAWLTYRYGVRPIIYDVEKLLNAIMNKPALRFTATGKITRDQTTVDDLAFNWSTHLKADGIRTTRHMVNVRAGIICEIPNPFLGLGRHWGADFTSLPGAIWELTPYSFVIDWVIGVGSALNALVKPLRVIEKGRWVVIREDTYSSRTVDLSLRDSYASYDYTNVSHDSLVWSKRTKTTTRLTDENIGVSAQDLLTGFSGSGVDVLKALDALALIMARF
jgi:hypothetical protein